MISSSRSFQTLVPTMTIAQGLSPAPTKTWSVIEGQWTKSHCLQVPLLAFDHEHALAGDHEEVLLYSLTVVQAGRLARLDDASWKPSSSNSASPSRFAPRP